MRLFATVGMPLSPEDSVPSPRALLLAGEVCQCTRSRLAWTRLTRLGHSGGKGTPAVTSTVQTPQITATETTEGKRRQAVWLCLPQPTHRHR